MKNEKYIGIEEVIHFEVLDKSLCKFLDGEQLTKKDYFLIIKEYIEGNNRAEKSAGAVNLIFNRQKELLFKLKDLLGPDNYLNIPKHEKIALFASLISLTFPISYKFFNIIGSIFKIQKVINKQTISKKLSNFYGTNRTVFNAMNTLLKMYIDYELIRRDLKGIYTYNERKIINNSIIKEVLLYTDVFHSKSRTALIDDLNQSSWFFFFQFDFEVKDVKNLNLLSFVDSFASGAYVKIN